MFNWYFGYEMDSFIIYLGQIGHKRENHNQSFMQAYYICLHCHKKQTNKKQKLDFIQLFQYTYIGTGMQVNDRHHAKPYQVCGS